MAGNGACRHDWNARGGSVAGVDARDDIDGRACTSVSEGGGTLPLPWLRVAVKLDAVRSAVARYFRQNVRNSFLGRNLDRISWHRSLPLFCALVAAMRLVSFVRCLSGDTGHQDPGVDSLCGCACGTNEVLLKPLLEPGSRGSIADL